MIESPSRSVVVRNAIGLHARPAAQFVRTANQFGLTTIRVASGDRTANAKSITAILALGVSPGTTITITTSGEDAQVALEALVAAVEAGLGEAL